MVSRTTSPGRTLDEDGDHNGTTGQDGAYLTAYLLEKDYKVVRSVQAHSSVDFWRLKDLGIETQAWHSMLQRNNSETYVLATGTTTSIRDFAKLVFQAVDPPDL